MTTEQIVHLLSAKKAGPNRWTAKCPVHKEKTASLSIRPGKKATLLYCFGCHAKSAQVLKALRLKPSAAFYDDGAKMNPDQRRAYKLKQQQASEMKQLELRWSIALWARWAYPQHRAAWEFVERMYWRAMKHLELEMDPERGARYLQAREIKRMGFDALWAKLEASAEWPAMMAEVQR